jgi:hypothetical protein
MSDKKNEPRSWEELAIGLYDKLTGRNAVIDYSFENFKIGVPRETGSEELTEWTMNGKISITTYERK